MSIEIGGDAGNGSKDPTAATFNKDMQAEIVAGMTPAEGVRQGDSEDEQEATNPYQGGSSDHYQWEEAHSKRVKRKRDIESVVSRIMMTGGSAEELEHLVANSIRKKTMLEGPSAPNGASLVRSFTTGDLSMIDNLSSVTKIEEAQQKMEGLASQSITTSVKNYLTTNLRQQIENNDIKHLRCDILEEKDSNVIWDALKTKALAQEAQVTGKIKIDGDNAEKRIKAIAFDQSVLYDEAQFTLCIAQMRKVEVVPLGATWAPLQQKLMATGSKGLFKHFDEDQADILVTEMKKANLSTLRQYISRCNARMRCTCTHAVRIGR